MLPSDVRLAESFTSLIVDSTFLDVPLTTSTTEGLLSLTILLTDSDIPLIEDLRQSEPEAAGSKYYQYFFTGS